MLIEQKPQKDFEPDAALDAGREYEARIVGVAHVGKHEKEKFGGDGKPSGEFQEIEQAIVMLELTEEDTFVERGPEDARVMKPRLIPQFIKWSSHEKSGMFKLAKNANPKAAWVEGKQGKVDTSLIIGEPVTVVFKEATAEGKQYIDEIKSIPAKYKDGVDAAQSTPFQYHVGLGSFPLADGTETKLEDVPVWIINYALNKAIDAEEFGQLDAMEAYVAEAEAAKDGNDVELEGDRLPAKESEEAKEEPVEETKEEVVEEKVEEKPKTSRRRSRKPAAKEDSGLKAELEAVKADIGALEDLAIEKGLAEDVLDAVGAEAGEDDDLYATKIIEAVLAL